ncbi:hypothetical protein N7495_000576 [Penicillium taxi]|uniref:uncharacterized protein n=1 Tax=Penicillium taxi TaxID=168475 RepID=UPI002544DC4A|nr:uncharacterized protein N7495_000576 [Penicillium taxi]KAJ5907894.1 hypothetical protein N7495_000576 [Penicillium taxi]
MAAAEGPARAHDRNARRRPFSNWMKRLANLKNSSDSGTTRWSNRRYTSAKAKKRSAQGNNNNPYPLSGTTIRQEPRSSYAESGSVGQGSRSDPSLVYSNYDSSVHGACPKSNAPTISTNGDTTISEAGYSKAGTMATTAGGGLSSHGGGEGSTFSSPAPSVRSVTTTLTTVQSAAPSTQLNPTQHAPHGATHGGSNNGFNNPQVQFSHQFPSSPAPVTATAVPPHLLPHSHSSMTYAAATANNVLTDNASILTLASSSQRRRRNSLDTNASVRGLAPSSLFGGSRESLPLSVLSGSVNEPSSTSIFNAQGILNRPSLVGLASTERISVYSASGATPLVNGPSERGSLYTTKPSATDGSSIRSSHGRNDSTAPSISGAVGSPLAISSSRANRRSATWGEIVGDEQVEGRASELIEEKTITPHGDSFPEEPDKEPENKS